MIQARSKQHIAEDNDDLRGLGSSEDHAKGDMMLHLTLSRHECVRMLSALLYPSEGSNRTTSTFRFGNITLHCSMNSNESSVPVRLPTAENHDSPVPLPTPPETERDPIVHIGPLMIDATRFEIQFDGQPITLCPSEFRLLYLLASWPGRVFNRRQIICALHGHLAVVTDKSVDATICNIRRKMGAAAHVIETVTGAGYRIREGF